MVVAWSDSESSDIESGEKKVANICLMAKEAQDDKNEYERSDEVDASLLYEYSKDELIDALISFANLETGTYLNTRILRKAFEN